MIRLAIPLLGLLVMGCAKAPQPDISLPAEPRLDREAVVRVIAMAADQIRPCYRSPRLSFDARQLVTVLRVRFAPDGTLAESPALVRQYGSTQVTKKDMELMATAASAAIVRCTPLRLPPELYWGGWNDFELTFSPKGLA